MLQDYQLGVHFREINEGTRPFRLVATEVIGLVTTNPLAAAASSPKG